jgi:hypothetical protein
MKKEVEEKLVDMLNWAEGALKTGSDFVVEQTPLYIQELLVYNFWTSLICFILSLLVFIGTIFGGYKFARWCKRTATPEALPALTITILPLMISSMTMSNHTDWFKIKMAPRVYIVDYLRTELKK